jgi:hypothetical protein
MIMRMCDSFDELQKNTKYERKTPQPCSCAALRTDVGKHVGELLNSSWQPNVAGSIFRDRLMAASFSHL